MYLTEFRKNTPKLGKWENLYQRVLESLSSWREAHEDMKISSELPRFHALRRLVYQVAREEVCNTETSYPIELMTYTLMQEWYNYHDRTPK